MRLPAAWLSTICVACLLVAACGGSSSGSGSANKTPYVFGMSADITGGAAVTGAPLYYGFKTYLDATNAKGGVNGHQIKFDGRDDQSNPSTARVTLQSLQGEGALGVFGLTVSPVAGALAPLAAQQKILQMSIGTPDSFIVPPQPYLYSTQVGAYDMAYTMEDFVTNVLIKNGTVPSQPKVAVLVNDSTTSSNMAKIWKSDFAGMGWKQVTELTIANTATDATSQNAQIAQANPDVVLAAILDSTAPFVVRGLQTRGWNKAFVAYVGASSEATFVGLQNPNYYAMRTYAYPKDPDIPAAVQMLKDANKSGATNGLESPFFTTGYVMAWLAVVALQRCSDPCTGEKYNTAMSKLGTVDVKGLAGTLTINDASHRALNSDRFFHWSSSAGHSVAVGDFIKSRAPTK
jgi:branched-chain amino acid transport system substrate-binding protein